MRPFLWRVSCFPWIVPDSRGVRTASHGKCFYSCGACTTSRGLCPGSCGVNTFSCGQCLHSCGVWRAYPGKQYADPGKQYADPGMNHFFRGKVHFSRGENDFFHLFYAAILPSFSDLFSQLCRFCSSEKRTREKIVVLTGRIPQNFSVACFSP